MGKEKKEPVKILNVRMSPDEYRELKKMYPGNFSATMRKHFQKIIVNEKPQIDAFKTCFCCKSSDNDVDELFLTPFWFEEKKKCIENTQFIICPSCRVKILTNGEKLSKQKTNNSNEIQLLILYHLLLRPDVFKGIPKEIINIIKLFPHKWKVKQGVITSTFSDENEFKNQFLQ